MRELAIKLNDKNKTEISIQKKIQIEKELIGKIIPHAGHKIFEINNETLEVKPAEFTNYTFILGNNHNRQEIICNADCTYVSALNTKNAMKQFKKGKNGSKDLSGGIEINPFKY
jgi:hypothetical protein